MNKFIATLVVLLPALDGLCQVAKEEYPSQQEKNYHKKSHYKEFEPEAISIIKSVKYDHISLRSQDTNNKFIAVWERTNYFKYYDSLEDICRTNLWKVIGTPKERKLDWDPVRYFKYYDSLEKLGIPKLPEDPKYKEADKKYDKCTDSVRKLIRHYKIANINSDLILRYDSLHAKRILVYEDYQFEELNAGYWVAISCNNGKSWDKYYTGLARNTFYYIKPNPRINLIKNDSTIQLEVAIVRQMKEWSPPGPAPEHQYELVQDNLIMEMDLQKLIADTDHDGLTDILERKLLTDPLSKDTDKDGIDDERDSNPRFKSIKNKYSGLFKYLLEHESIRDTFISFENFKLKARVDANSRSGTYYIVTDDKNLSGLYETRDRYIFLNAGELFNYRKEYHTLPHRVRVSPMFRVDNEPQAWKIYVNFLTWGTDYLIIEKQTGWVIKIIRRWVT